MYDSAAAADRICPGGPGEDHSFGFAATASVYKELRAKVGNEVPPPVYISIKVTVAAHIVFGDENVGAPTTGDTLFEPSDGWQDMILRSGFTGYRIIGATTSGTVFVWFSGH